MVGGGALLAPSELKGTSEMLRRPSAGILNTCTMSATTARSSIVIDAIKTIGPKMEQQWLEVIKETVADKIIHSGTLRSPVQIAEMEIFLMAEVYWSCVWCSHVIRLAIS